EDVTLSQVAEFNSKDIGTTKSITLTEATLGGSDASNYTVSLTDVPTTTADITAKELMIAGSFSVDDKSYDGTDNATISTNTLTLQGRVPNETVNLQGLRARFS